MRHIIGVVSQMPSFGLTKIRTGRCKKKDKDHMEFQCELYEAQAACGRYFVHELTSEVNSRMKCVTIMAMSGTRTTIAELCMHVMKEDQDLSTRAYGRSPTRAKLECGCKVNSQARIDTLVLVRTAQARNGTNRNMGTSSCLSNGGTVERGQAGVEDAGTEEEGKGCKEDTRNFHENDKNKGTSPVQDEM